MRISQRISDKTPLGFIARSGPGRPGCLHHRSRHQRRGVAARQRIRSLPPKAEAEALQADQDRLPARRLSDPVEEVRHEVLVRLDGPYMNTSAIRSAYASPRLRCLHLPGVLHHAIGRYGTGFQLGISLKARWRRATNMRTAFEPTLQPAGDQRSTYAQDHCTFEQRVEQALLRADEADAA